MNTSVSKTLGRSFTNYEQQLVNLMYHVMSFKYTIDTPEEIMSEMIDVIDENNETSEAIYNQAYYEFRNDVITHWLTNCEDINNIVSYLALYMDNEYQPTIDLAGIENDILNQQDESILPLWSDDEIKCFLGLAYVIFVENNEMLEYEQEEDQLFRSYKTAATDEESTICLVQLMNLMFTNQASSSTIYDDLSCRCCPDDNTIAFDRIFTEAYNQFIDGKK